MSSSTITRRAPSTLLPRLLGLTLLALLGLLVAVGAQARPATDTPTRTGLRHSLAPAAPQVAIQ